MKKIYTAVLIGVMFSTMALTLVLYVFISNKLIILFGVIFFLIQFFWIWLLLDLIEKKLFNFTNHLCFKIDEMIKGEPYKNEVENETLLSKVNHKLERLYNILQSDRRQIKKEKEELQILISDISHQVKTPISNIKMIIETIRRPEITRSQRVEFIDEMDGQVGKLDFLISTMIKASRLETGALKLIKKPMNFYETLANSLGGILLWAERKKLSVNVNCDEKLVVNHDRKWTAEAIFNVLDNAVKYTGENGVIQISVDKLDIYTRIDIKDNGIGIPESSQGSIFRRFYREPEVCEIDGMGIGLYITRQIISIQGGYIKVSSKVGEGSTFSIFLPTN